MAHDLNLPFPIICTVLKYVHIHGKILHDSCIRGQWNYMEVVGVGGAWLSLLIAGRRGRVGVAALYRQLLQHPPIITFLPRALVCRRSSQRCNYYSLARIPHLYF